MGRFNDILRGPSLNKAYEKYKEWLEKSPDERSTAYQAILLGDRAKYERQVIWVDGFGDPANIHLQTRGLATGNSAPAPIVLNLLTGRFETSAPSSGTNMQVKNFKPAKLGLRQSTGALVNRTSRQTGRKYKGRNTDSASSSFGRKTPTESEPAAIADILGDSALETFLTGGEGRGYFFVDEEL